MVSCPLDFTVLSPNTDSGLSVSGPELLVSAVRESLSGSYASPLSVLKGAPTVQLNVEKFSI